MHTLHKLGAVAVAVLFLAAYTAVAQPNPNRRVHSSQYRTIHHSQAIRQAQRELRARGLYHGRIDGINGPKTQAAVRRYQRRNNLAATGRLDRRTARSLGLNVSAQGRYYRHGAASRAGVASRMTGNASPASIRQTQRELRRQGYYHGRIDGVMGPQTRRALRRYQQANNMPVTGRLTRPTAQRMGVATSGQYFESAGSSITGNYSRAGHQVASGASGMASRMQKGNVGSGLATFGKGVGHGAVSVGRGTAHAAEKAFHGVEHAVKH